MPAIDQLMTVVANIKAQGDKAGAQALVTKYADDATDLLQTITERWDRVPRTSMVYAVRI